MKGEQPIQEMLSSEERKCYEEKIRQSEYTMATQSSRINELEELVAQLLRENELAQEVTFKGSELDRALTLDYIISQIEHRRTFRNSWQLIDLLKTSKLIRMATDEEVAKIDKIEQQMLDASVPSVHNDIKDSHVFQAPVYGASFPLPGAQVTIHQYYGGKKPKEMVSEGKVESAEEREKRKVEVMKSITDRFEFTESQLGYDNNKKRITNSRLTTLFRKIFGIGGYPTAENKALMEQLWRLLIDERNQCNKEPGEGFFRQTVLNILGKFKQNDILFGTKNELMKVVFPKANEGLVKNIERGIPASFPEGTDDMIDFYIEQLMKGDF